MLMLNNAMRVCAWLLFIACHLSLASNRLLTARDLYPPSASASHHNTGKSSLYGLDGAGDVIFISDALGYKNAFRLSLHTGSPDLLFQKEFFDRQVSQIYPSGNKFIFISDVEGNERYQLYFSQQGFKTPVLLSDGKSRNESVVWSRSGQAFAYSSTSRNGHDMDVYIRYLGSAAERITSFEGSWFPLAWSPDGTRLVINKYVSENESEAFLYDLLQKKFIYTFSAGPTVNYQKFVFNENGSQIFFLSRSHTGYINLQVMGINSHKTSNLTADISWDVEDFAVASNSHVYFITNENGYSRLNDLNLVTKKITELRTGSADVIHSILLSRDGKYLFYSGGDTNTPTSLYKLNLTSQKYSRLLPAGFEGKPSGKIQTRLITYRSSLDHRLIPAFVSQPAGSGPFPVIISIHGGPEYQARPEFNALNSYLVNSMHMILIQPNIRGSSGYGVEYMNLDNDVKRQNAISDIGDLIEWARKNRVVNKNQIILSGGSYGGYVVLDSLTTFPDKICAGIDLMGPANLITYLENTEGYRKELRRKEYGDERIPSVRSFMSQTAPVNNINRISSSLLIVAGENDPRVPFTESLLMYQALRSAGHDVDLIKLSREGHFITGAADRASIWSAQVNFITRQLNRCKLGSINRNPH